MKAAVHPASGALPGAHAGRFSLLRGGTVVALAQGCDLAAGLSAAALVARYLGPSGLGELSLLLAAFLAANTVADLGASALLTREVAKAPSLARPRLRTYLELKLLLLALLSLVVVFIGAGFGFSSAQSLTAVATGIPFLAFSAFNVSFAAALRGIGLLPPLLCASLPAAIGQSLGALLLLRQGGGLVSLLLLMGAAQGFKLLLLGFSFLRATEAGGRETPGAAARLFRAVLPFAGVVVLGTAYLKVDVFLLSALAGPVETGYFGAAARVTELLKLLPGAFLAVLYPELVRRESETRLLPLAWGAAAGSVVLAAAAPLLIGLLYGPELSPASLPLQILALGLLPGVLNTAMVLQLYARSEEGKVLRIFAIGLLVKATLDILLIPLAGAVGASLALLGSEGLLFVLYRRALAKERLSIPAWLEVMAFAAGAFAVRVALIALYPAFYGGDPVARMLHPERLVLAYQLPLLQALVALSYRLLDDPLAPRLLSAATGALATAGAYLLAARLLDTRAARWTAALFLVNPLFITYSLMPYQESLMMALLALGGASYLSGRRIATSLFLGLACLTRYESWVVAAALAALEVYRTRGKRLFQTVLLFGWAPLLWVLAQGGLGPPGTYVADTGWNWARLGRLSYLGERVAVHAPFIIVLAPAGLWLTARARSMCVFLGVIATVVITIVVLGHDYPPGTSGVSERAAHLPLGAALLLSGAALARLPVGRKRLMALAVGVVLSGSLTLAVRQVKARVSEPAVAGSYAIASYLGSRLGPGERALVVARPMNDALIRHYLDLIAARKPAEVGEAERLVAALSLPEDYQRLAIALPRGRERLVPAEAWQGESVSLAVVFDDASERVPAGLGLIQPPQVRFSEGREASIYSIVSR